MKELLSNRTVQVIGSLIILTIISLSLMAAFNIGIERGKVIATEQSAVAIEYSMAMARTEYYRGGFDMCTVVATQILGLPNDTAIQSCLNIIKQAALNQAYEEESPSWDPTQIQDVP